MVTTIVSVFISFVLVTVIGGLFAQGLQHRNWIRQQHIAAKDRRITELKAIFSELDALLSKRLYKTRRLLYSLRRISSGSLQDRLKDYDATLSEWNEKRNSFQIRLVRVISVSLAQQFEHDLSRRFVNIGQSLERLVRAESSDSLPPSFYSTLTSLETELDLLSRSVYEFLRAIYIHLQTEQDQLFYIDNYNKVPETEEELDNVSTWYLFKSLFIPPPILRKES
jgi:hypothetical protein